ncbi:hypothetical protein CFF27374_09155 [Campylobacter fetus subsp. fetus]|nr:hypothetical protein CFF27374_09155 [Campylobacter fetus subsp. fetus]
MNNRRDFIKFMLLIIDMPNKIFASSGSKTLVVYYLHTLNTHILASYIQHIVGADMLKLETFDTYLINYDQMVSLAAKKQKFKEKTKRDLFFNTEQIASNLSISNLQNISNINK